MVGQLQGVAEAPAAQRAVEADPRRVRQLVFPQRPLLFEGFLADGAAEGPGVCVQLLVSAQGAGEGEALPTFGAGVGFLSRVGPQVLLHVDVLDEALLTGGALKRTLT